jgi:amylosucrase
MDREAARTLQRLLPRIEPYLPKRKAERDIFLRRLEEYFPAVFNLLLSLYGSRYDFFYHLEHMLLTIAQGYTARPADLRALDQRREADPHWFHSHRMIGGVCYVDRFGGTLQGVRAKIPYFKELGLTYLHLMPLFKMPVPENDGGYAVSSFREVHPSFGTWNDLTQLAADLRAEGISLVLDFVFNHTSDEHEWAQKALAGDQDYQDFYLLFPDRTLPDQYERSLREIFPEQDPGSFTFRPEINQWAWTTFRRFQWDLNYANPAVFTAMLGEMLHIANAGAEVLRLDAVAFIWKQLGTSCENLPQVHVIIRAFNALLKIAAPAVLFKSEAIVHPRDVATYIHPAETPISYNPTLMALLWEALATRKVALLSLSMQRHFTLAEGCTWVDYVRCHDDIGWTFADEDAADLGVNGFDHRQFLNSFYTGKFPGSFARGVPFNYNPLTRDMRISGMGASLAGLESESEHERENAVRRLELIHAMILSAGGIPLIYLGDEIAITNDYAYAAEPAKSNDSRWIHRPAFDWARAEQRHNVATPQGHLFTTLQKLIRIRQNNATFGNGSTQFFDTGNRHVLGFVRHNDLLVLANFSEQEQRVGARWKPQDFIELVSGKTYPRDDALTLAPYQFLWLVPTT